MGGRKMNLGTRILVMGLTDSGKSRFISEMCEYFSWSSKGSTPPVKPGLNLDTRHEKEFPSTTDNGDRVTLVNTSGFDNMSMSNTDILEEIMKWMSASHSANAPVNGIIYPHWISDPRMTPAAIASLRVLQKFCGESNFPGVALATTFWDYGYSSPALREQFKSRYQDLKLTFWKGLLDKGSQAFLMMMDHLLGRMLSMKRKTINDLETGKQLFEAQISGLNHTLPGKYQVNTELRKSIETEKKSLENEVIELRSAVQEKEEVVSRLQITFIQGKKLYVDQNAKLNNILDEKKKDITRLQDFFMEEERLRHDKTIERKKSIQEKNDELARLKGQQAI